MKRNIGLLAGLVLAVACTSRAQTEDHLQKTFTVSPGGKLVVDVNVGSIDVAASDRKDVSIELFRKVTARGIGGGEEREKAELKNNEVTFTQEGNKITDHAGRLKGAERENTMSMN